ncbi:MAG: hypothetical protein H6R10_408 [Rhodocyclaceae bacterium]|nr:hypothetical protein [Rhodocyclaceae bacterium]
MSRSIDFFETQFRRQVDSGDLALNPFEAAALPYLRGRVLDFGCGLGNLALAAARNGCPVVALDGSPTAIRQLAGTSAREGLALEAIEADLGSYCVAGEFDTAVSIGLLMFLDCGAARHQLARLQDCVRPGGTAVVNVLIEGTTYLDMFDPAAHCLFGRDELGQRFAGWEILGESFDEFPAPGGTVKSFATVIARKPEA